MDREQLIEARIQLENSLMREIQRQLDAFTEATGGEYADTVDVRVGILYVVSSVQKRSAVTGVRVNLIHQANAVY